MTLTALLRAICGGVTGGGEVGAAVAGHSMWMKEDGHGFETTMKYIAKQLKKSFSLGLHNY